MPGWVFCYCSSSPVLAPSGARLTRRRAPPPALECPGECSATAQLAPPPALKCPGGCSATAQVVQSSATDHNRPTPTGRSALAPLSSKTARQERRESRGGQSQHDESAQRTCQRPKFLPKKPLASSGVAARPAATNRPMGKKLPTAQCYIKRCRSGGGRGGKWGEKPVATIRATALL